MFFLCFKKKKNQKRKKFRVNISFGRVLQPNLTFALNLIFNYPHASEGWLEIGPRGAASASLSSSNRQETPPKPLVPLLFQFAPGLQLEKEPPIAR